ncbi:hypothetical protein SDC9_101947 [bioreactor metagenome]|uniref:Uncharacterized protein n=1 Tax=bioreactor metagenome TaxID=1076179 RepID=A0A645B065_9ZZZZ
MVGNIVDEGNYRSGGGTAGFVDFAAVFAAAVVIVVILADRNDFDPGIGAQLELNRLKKFLAQSGIAQAKLSLELPPDPLAVNQTEIFRIAL